MSFEEFKSLVGLMRKTQKEYFRTRTQADLNLAKRLEQRVDDVLEGKINTLF